MLKQGPLAAHILYGRWKRLGQALGAWISQWGLIANNQRIVLLQTRLAFRIVLIHHLAILRV
jgi:hypothetical protein